MSLKIRLTEDMKTAMRAKDQVSLGTIRLINAAVKQFEVDERTEADDAKITAILTKMVKQRKDSAKIYTEAGRQDLADKERGTAPLPSPNALCRRNPYCGRSRRCRNRRGRYGGYGQSDGRIENPTCRQSRYGRSQQNPESRTDRLIARISDKMPSEARIAGSDGIFMV